METVWDQLTSCESVLKDSTDAKAYEDYRNRKCLIQFLMALTDDYEPLTGHLITACPTRPPHSDQNKYHPRPKYSQNVPASTAAAATESANPSSLNLPSVSPSDIESLLKQLLFFSGNTSAALSTPPGNSKWIVGRDGSSGLDVRSEDCLSLITFMFLLQTFVLFPFLLLFTCGIAVLPTAHWANCVLFCLREF
ncbi:hypothetical protein PIB30_044966 [Stylosanthes scabra]|uniref:Uncharacterized protein n=1 Tax=Stylosanthes scabra TaxID=79078 RepID=A0ABU6TFT1_9FABA|nr:hypothetical protein [Stylosanthes scabra]